MLLFARVGHSFLKSTFLAPKLGSYSGLSLKKLLCLFAITSVICITVGSVERSDVNSHIFVRNAVAVEGEAFIA